MPSINYLALASAILSLTTAAPFGDKTVLARNAATPKTFSVGQSIQKPSKSGPAAMAGVYHKYHATMPADVAAAASGDGTGTANPTQYDSSYLVPVDVGGTTLNLDFDTGSSDLWAFSAELPAADQTGHNIYQPSSSAQQLSGSTWSISYGDGSSASGNVYLDTVSVGTATVTSQAVEAAATISSEFVQDTGTDGLLGLAFDSINTVSPTQQKTFISNLLGSLQAPVFTADLKKGIPGTYDFGFIDSSKYTGQITYVPISTSQGFWEFTADGYAVGTGAVTSTSIDGIADTGTTLLLLDDSIVTAYYGQVSGASYDSTQGGYTFDCSATLPDFTAVIGGYSAVIPGSYLNYAPASGSKCFGGLQSNSGVGISIFGDIFLKSQFIVFDRSVPQLGVAAKSL